MTITHENLTNYVGKPIFTHDRMYEITPPGVVMGLAWTAMGGSTLYIETAKRRSEQQHDSSSNDSDGIKAKKLTDGSLHLTGHLGDVMKESAQIALTVARNFIKSKESNNGFLETAYVYYIIKLFLSNKFSNILNIFIVIYIYMYQKGQHVKMDRVLVLQ